MVSLWIGKSEPSKKGEGGGAGDHAISREWTERLEVAPMEIAHEKPDA
jgi:hypothetical protein